MGIAKLGIFAVREVRAVTRLDADANKGLGISEVERGTDTVPLTFVLKRYIILPGISPLQLLHLRFCKHSAISAEFGHETFSQASTRSARLGPIPSAGTGAMLGPNLADLWFIVGQVRPVKSREIRLDLTW